jgi:signal transduction histidine kinase/DNA-binding response OmpR family regulator/CHASE3 domain sensor protein
MNSNNFRRNLFVSSVLSMLILIISSTASYLSIKSLLESNALVSHTQQVIYHLNRTSMLMSDAQTSVRGFIITGKTAFLVPYENAEKRADSYFDSLETLTDDNPAQKKSMAKLKELRKGFFEYLEARIDAKKQGYTIEAAQIDTGRILMQEIRGTLETMETREQQLLKTRNEEASRNGTYSTGLILVAAFIALLISIIFFIRILNDFRMRGRLQQELLRKDEQMAERIRVISHLAGQISKGNYGIRVDDRESDALGSVALSLNGMAESLQQSFRQLNNKEWLQAGIAGLNNVMLGEKSIKQLSTDIIEFLAEYTASHAALLYLTDGNSLQMTSGYGFVPNKNRERIAFGDGLSGQAAVSEKTLELTAFSPEDITITYALGEIRPSHVVAIPLIETRVEGVAELASVKRYTPLQMEFLSQASANIGIALKAAQSRKRVQELLEETQAQSEELSTQHSEMESLNAELEAQTEKLQASEEELRVQQEELQQTNEELSERSVLLEERNTEIQKKSEDLERSTRYKSEFLANMSHELRTPLNSILLLSRLLSENNEKNMSDEQTEFAKVIHSSGNGLLGLIDEILDLSKIEAGKMELEYHDIAIVEITDGLKGLFGEVAKQKKIGFRIIADDAPIVIKTDKMRVEQILKNLLSNAVKFTSKGEVTLEITKKSSDPRFVSFIVKDTGIGISPEQQPLIFEAFQQADGSTKRKYGGTGLGLSISRELAKLLKGEITLSSTVNEGSIFTLTIPITGNATGQLIRETEPMTEERDMAEKQEDTSNEYISASIPEEVPDDRNNINAGDKIILIVEDDTNFAKSLLDFTHQRGYKGIVSVRGDEAMNTTLKFQPVGILLDIQLPIKSGWQVMEELKNNTLTRHIPVHIMSSHKVKQESLLKGAVHFLDKPLAYEQMPDIFRRIEHIISRESQKVLIIEDNPKHAKALAYFLETNSINAEIKSDVAEGVDVLKNAGVDCVILDMGIPDKQSYDLLENVKKDAGLENLPVIVFTGKSLSLQEELRIKKYADSIVVKTAHSYQRMLDEVSLFLHLVEENKRNGAKKNGNRKMHQMNDVLEGKTVLVVDDDVRNIYSLTKSLEVLQMTVITAIDGREALKAMEEHPEIDVVLLDMMMPNMDGYETAQRIRANKKYKNLPVIAVTAKAMTGDREKCINAGASDYITKPVDADQLLSLLRVWLYDKK